ncbi:glucosamine 6-phosphate N-acetyltransferase-like [Haliotis rufescens]|uniref:glucosamine 6-phosphate N-acetyltransferase-like n=1 Tax=Haliotis rufescens TaxID=6454 RepID=UPI00201EB037|nr:glucosamine 6-phosphate N-acetyltransferase-like [Haliotis rufescens]
MYRRLKMATESGSKTENGLVDGQECYQYDPEILKLIDFSESPAQYKPPVSPAHPGDNLVMRPLCLADYDKGFLQLLTHLTKVGDISREEFEARFMQMKKCPENYYVTVIENTESGQIIASATLVKETKFIHQASARGRVEDVVVSDLYRGKQLGKLLVDSMTLLSAKVGCYKVSLECRDPLVKFYSQFGFKKEENQNYMMQKWWN